MIFEQRKTFPADNTFRIDDDDMGNTFDFQDFVPCYFSIYSVIIFDNGFFHRFNLFYRFVRNADNDDIFRKFFGNLVELGNCFPAGATPGSPKVDDDEFSLSIGFFRNPGFYG